MSIEEENIFDLSDNGNRTSGPQETKPVETEPASHEEALPPASKLGTAQNPVFPTGRIVTYRTPNSSEVGKT
jgi:hypothetical protein